MANSTLEAIRLKVRRITRTPSTDQMSDATLDEYINTFILYDFPEHLRLFTLRTTFSFVCSPYVDAYKTTDDFAGDQFYNFKNVYTTLHEPVYVAGYKARFTQDEEQFYGWYPRNNFIVKVATGDGVTRDFTGTLSNIPITQSNVVFTSIGNNDQAVSLVDVPVVDAFGTPTVDGNLYATYDVPDTPPDAVVPGNNINYKTGVYNLHFDAAPAARKDINAQTVPYVAARPQAVLYYNNTLYLRPIPDQPYKITLEAYKRPTELLNVASVPELEQWWQYISYGAAKKVFEDRMDMDSVQMIMPEFMKQETLVLRRTIVQNSTKRAATLYTEQTGFGAPLGNWWNGGPF